MSKSNKHTITQEEFDKRYIVGKILGEGAFGKVYEGKDKSNKKKIAIKEFYVKKDEFKETLEELDKEWSILSKLSHPNLVNYHAYYRIKGQYKLYLIMDFVNGKELEEYRDNIVNYMHHFWTISADIFDALSYMHENGVAHRDVKSANVMVQPDGKAILVDYGMACLVREKRTGRLVCPYRSLWGTIAYMSPEIFKESLRKDEPYIFYSNDVWSAGVTLYELYFGKIYLDDVDEYKYYSKKDKKSLSTITQEYIENITTPMIPDPNNIYEEYIDYILNISYKERPTAADCYNLAIDVIEQN